MSSETNANNTIIVSCPGGSNVSLISYKVATILEKSGCGKFLRLRGDKFQEKDQEKLLDAAKTAGKWVLIDGCPKACGKTALEKAGIQADRYVVVTSLGIEREMKINFTENEVNKVLEEARKACES